jgi:hypothetical protein
MNAWNCAALIAIAGGLGGVVNALFSGNGFVLPRYRNGILCPGAFSNVFIRAFAACASWAFYGSGAGIDLARSGDHATVSLQFSALAGALLVGVAGAKWITNEVDKRLLKESVRIAAGKNLSAEQSDELIKGPALEVLERVKAA